MKQSLLITLAAVAVLAGCAKRPDAIAPIAMPTETYAALQCQEINNSLVAEKGNLATLSAAQNSAANADAMGVFLVGVPVASLTDGDKEGLIAVSKGKIQALESAKVQKGC